MSDYQPMSKMSECPKCGSGNISGPVYEWVGGEKLRYTCCRCGYSECHPCKDAKAYSYPDGFAGQREEDQPTSGKP